MELLQQLTALLQNDILPRIPQEGSVGASGDLTPLSYVAAVMCGQRDCLLNGDVIPAKLALAKVRNGYGLLARTSINGHFYIFIYSRPIWLL
jgi:histidine ammonia-lyase